MSSLYSLEELTRARRWMLRLCFIDIILIGFVGLFLSFAAMIYSPRLFPPYGLFYAGMDLPEWTACATIGLMVVTGMADSWRICRLLRKPSLALLGVWGALLALHIALEASDYRMGPLFRIKPKAGGRS